MNSAVGLGVKPQWHHPAGDQADGTNRTMVKLPPPGVSWRVACRAKSVAFRTCRSGLAVRRPGRLFGFQPSPQSQATCPKAVPAPC